MDSWLAYVLMALPGSDVGRLAALLPIPVVHAWFWASTIFFVACLAKLWFTCEPPSS